MVYSNADPPLFSDFRPVSTEEWEALIRAESGEESLDWRSVEGIALRAFYRAEDLEEIPSIPSSMRLRGDGSSWLIRQDVDAHDPGEANAEAVEAIAGGAEALGLRIAAACRSGDFGRLLDGISLPDVRLYLRVDGSVIDVIGLLEAEIVHQGLDRAAILGGIESNPGPGFDVAAEVVIRAADTLPGLRVLDISGAPYHDAGASAVQELGCMAAAVTETLAALGERGISSEAAARQLQLTVPVGPVYLIEIAKLRALRLIAGQILAEFGAEGISPPIIAHTSRRSESGGDPHLNIVRGTAEAAAAVLGGADVMVVRPFDEAATSRGALGRRLARNTQLILRHEARLADVSDPAAGSYYIEKATAEIASAGWAFFQEIERRGGLGTAEADGFVQHELAQTRARRVQAAGALRVEGSSPPGN
jgi:methylmalonyl-CoA mutase